MKKTTLILASVIVSPFLSLHSVKAANGTWATPVSGTWSNTANWVSGVIAEGISTTASIPLNSGQTVTLTGTGQTVGILNIGPATGATTLTRSGTTAVLTMDNGGLQSVINWTGSNGSSAISVPLLMTAGGLRLNQGSSGNASFALSNVTTTAATTGTQTLVINHAGSSAFALTGVSNGANSTVAVLLERGGLTLGSSSFTGGISVWGGAGLTLSTSAAPLSTITMGSGSSGVATLGFSSGTFANNIVVSSAAGTTVRMNSGNGINALFTGTVTLATGKTLIVTPQVNSTVTFAGPLTGGGALGTQQNNGGTNVIALTGSNNHTGGVSLGTSGGIRLNIGNANALGTGTFSTGDATARTGVEFDNTTGSALTLATNNAQAWGASSAFVGSNDLDMGNGGVTILNASSAILNVMASKLTVGGVIAGTNKSIYNLGSGTLALTGASTYTGVTGVGGNLSVTSLANGGAASSIGAATNAAANLLINRGTLQYTGTGSTTDRLFTVGNGGGTIESSGTGALVFSNTGAIVSTGTFAAGTFTFSGTTTTVNVGNTAGYAVGQTITGSNIAANTVISQILDGTRIVISNSTTGTTTGGVYSIGELNRTLTLTGTNAGNNTIAGSLANASGTTTLGVTKNGSGKWILSGSSSYTGNTAVNAGTLVISGSGRISNSSAVTVAAGADFAYNSSAARTGSITLNGSGSSRAILSGTGVINMAITLNDVGDTLSPGNSPGLGTYGVSQTWESFTYVWETNDFVAKVAGTNFDQVNITGSLGLTGGLGDYVLDITSLTSGNVAGFVGNFDDTIDQSWIILTTTTGITGFDAANWTLLTDNFTSNPAWIGTWSLAQVNNDLVLSYAVPEPSTMILMGLGLGAVFLLRRKGRMS